MLTGIRDFFFADLPDIHLPAKPNWKDDRDRRRWEESKKVDLCARALDQVKEVGAIVPVRAARVPIVKFAHRATGIRSDLSFKNLMSVMNTKFIRFAAVDAGDDRVFLLMMTLRYDKRFLI